MARMQGGSVKLALALGAAAVFAGTGAAATIPRAEHTSAGTKAARASLLRVGDFGSGWLADAAPGTSPGLNFSCQGYTPKQGDIIEIGTATSPTYKAPSPGTSASIGPFVMQKTSVYESENAARTLWRRTIKQGLVACVAHSLDGLAARGVTVNITAREPLAFGRAGDRSAGYRVVATLTTTKQRLKTYFDVLLVGGGNAITELTVSSFLKPPPLKWESALAKIAARRLGASGNVA